MCVSLGVQLIIIFSLFLTGLAANNSLIRLDLSSNSLGAHSTRALARALTSQRALTFLSIADNVLRGEEGGIAARVLIECGVGLTELLLGGNELGQVRPPDLTSL